MNICLIGDGLTNLVLAKILANKNISISVCFESKKTKKSTSRTIGISKNNFIFLNLILQILKKLAGQLIIFKSLMN